jgi:hypothetical protein
VAKSCLVKDPDVRLRLVSWESFEEEALTSPSGLSKLRERLGRAVRSALQLGPAASERVREAALSTLYGSIRDACLSGGVFPPVEITEAPAPLTGWKVGFGKSSRHGLGSPVVALLAFENLQTEPPVVRLEAAAALVDVPPNGLPPAWTVVYEGPAQAMPIEIISHLLDRVVDRACEEASAGALGNLCTSR